MKAVIKTGGKQYYVAEGESIYVEKLDNEVGSEVEFTEVLFVDGVAGKPVVDGAKVVCTVDKHGRQKKINIFKYRNKTKSSRGSQGHRQAYTKLTVKKIVK